MSEPYLFLLGLFFLIVLIAITIKFFDDWFIIITDQLADIADSLKDQSKPK